MTQDVAEVRVAASDTREDEMAIGIRERRRGMLKVGSARETNDARFARLTSREGDCLRWHGRYYFSVRVDRAGKPYDLRRPHVYAYERAYGEQPGKPRIVQTCDPATYCVEPTHQRKAPANTADVARNEAVLAALVTGESLVRIAARFGVTRQRVHQLAMQYLEPCPTCRGSGYARRQEPQP